MKDADVAGRIFAAELRDQGLCKGKLFHVGSFRSLLWPTAREAWATDHSAHRAEGTELCSRDSLFLLNGLGTNIGSNPQPRIHAFIVVFSMGIHDAPCLPFPLRQLLCMDDRFMWPTPEVQVLPEDHETAAHVAGHGFAHVLSKTKPGPRHTRVGSRRRTSNTSYKASCDALSPLSAGASEAFSDGQPGHVHSPRSRVSRRVVHVADGCISAKLWPRGRRGVCAFLFGHFVSKVLRLFVGLHPRKNSQAIGLGSCETHQWVETPGAGRRRFATGLQRSEDERRLPSAPAWNVASSRRKDELWRREWFVL
mmetsp:Transcript_50852/g.135760  ORF Transcript_50852/g.135760 Transcript_50852/m.135760 type:complete len:309 (-) Transcript_50852:188-1114(-)